MPTNGFSSKPLKVKLLAGEQKATEVSFPCREVVALFQILGLFGDTSSYRKLGLFPAVLPGAGCRFGVCRAKVEIHDVQMPTCAFIPYLGGICNHHIATTPFCTNSSGSPPNLGPPVVPLYPFLGRVPLLK